MNREQKSREAYNKLQRIFYYAPYENKKSFTILMLGGSGQGKTSLLNFLANL